MKKIIISIFFLIYSHCLFANQDSLIDLLATNINDKDRVEVLCELSKKMFRNDFNQAKTYLKEAYLIANRINYISGIYSVLHIQGMMVAEKGNLDSAIQIYDKAILLAQNENDTIAVGRLYIAKGNIYDIRKDFKNALKYYFKGDSCVSITTNELIKGMSNMGIGNIYLQMEQFANAIEKYQLSVKQLTLAKSAYVSWSINNLATAFEHLGQYDSSLYYYKKSLKSKLETNDLYGAAFSYNDIGGIYTKLGEYKKAKEYHEKALDLKLKLGNVGIETIGNTYLALSIVELKLKNYKKASLYLENAHQASLKSGATALYISTLKAKSEYYEALGNVDSALIVLHDYIKKNDSLQRINNTQILADLETKFETEKKQREILILEKDKKLNQQIINNQQMYLIFTFMVILMVVFFLIIIYKRLKITRKQKEIIEEQKEEVESQRDLIEQQKEVVEEAHKEIKDSINYAKRIQEAILPSLAQIKKLFPQSFVFYHPKDVVAGDFYWQESVGNLIYIAAADCTGHGVPGAMVSVVCSNALTKAVLEDGISDVGIILDRTREIVIDKLAKNGDVKDGMDISLACFDIENMKLEWAGANNPLYLLRKEEIQITKGDREPIGFTDSPTPFTNHQLTLTKGDTIYLFTDGFADQFGGPDGKKLGYSKFRDKLISISNEDMLTQKEILLSYFNEWKGSEEQVDDVCIIVVRV